MPTVNHYAATVRTSRMLIVSAMLNMKKILKTVLAERTTGKYRNPNSKGMETRHQFFNPAKGYNPKKWNVKKASRN